MLNSKAILDPARAQVETARAPVVVIGTDSELRRDLARMVASEEELVEVPDVPDGVVRCAADLVWRTFGRGRRRSLEWRRATGQEGPNAQLRIATKAVDRLRRKHRGVVIDGFDRLHAGTNAPWSEADPKLVKSLRDAARLICSPTISAATERWQQDRDAVLVDLDAAADAIPAEQLVSRPSSVPRGEWREIVARAREELSVLRLVTLTLGDHRIDHRRVRGIVEESPHTARELLLNTILGGLGPRDAILLEVLALVRSGFGPSRIDFDDLETLRSRGLATIDPISGRVHCHAAVGEVIRTRLWQCTDEASLRFDIASDLLDRDLRDLAAYSDRDALHADERPFDLVLSAVAGDRLDLIEHVAVPKASYLKWRATHLSEMGRYPDAARLYERVLEMPGLSNDPYAIEYLNYNRLKAREITAAEAIAGYRIAADSRPTILLYRKRLVEALIEAGEDEWRRQFDYLCRRFAQHDQLHRFALPEIARTLRQHGYVTAANEVSDRIVIQKPVKGEGA